MEIAVICPPGLFEHQRFFKGVFIAFVDGQQLALVLERFSIRSDFEVRHQSRHGFAATTMFINTHFFEGKPFNLFKSFQTF